MNILVTNDDGADAEGIKVLATVAKEFGNVAIVGPDRERSACGHAMTMRDPLRVKESDWNGIPVYAVNGLPVDCVNIGLHHVFNQKCDLVLSGINNGPNLGFDITYSGTVAGAMEGCINGIPSISFSMAFFVDGAPLHYETGEWWLKENLEMLISMAKKPLTFLNVNIPALAQPEIVGHKIVTMGKRVYEERVEPREDPWGRTYFWQGGVVTMQSTEKNTDVHAVSNGYVSITPISLNWADQEEIERLNSQKS